MAAQKSGDQSYPLLCPKFLSGQKTSHGYIELLSDCSTYLPKTPTMDTGESITSPISGTHPFTRISKSQTELLDKDPGKACSSRPVDLSLEMDIGKEQPKLFSQYNGELSNKVMGQQYPMHTQNHNLTEELTMDGHNHSQTNYTQPHSATNSQGGSRPRARSSSRERAIATDRKRRLLIDERIKALQELLPYTVQGGQVSVLDAIIDHIKYLQFQMKDLSQARLGGESPSDAFIFLEGYGHYILDEKTLDEPLEEVMGKLLEFNQSAATLLLESRGLFVMPMALVDELYDAI